MWGAAHAFEVRAFEACMLLIQKQLSLLRHPENPNPYNQLASNHKPKKTKPNFQSMHCTKYSVSYLPYLSQLYQGKSTEHIICQSLYFLRDGQDELEQEQGDQGSLVTRSHMTTLAFSEGRSDPGMNPGLDPGLTQV